MKITEMKNKFLCDNCGTEAWHHCAGCPADYCGDCRGKYYVDFTDGVSFSGADLTVCNKCLLFPPIEIRAALSAYLKIKDLRDEKDIFSASFEKKREQAEKEVRKFNKFIANLR